MARGGARKRVKRSNTQPSPRPAPVKRERDADPRQDGNSMGLDVERLPTPRKGNVDKNEYRRIRLPNGIECLLISQPDEAKDRPYWHHRTPSRLGFSDFAPSVRDPSSPLFNYGGTPLTSRRGQNASKFQNASSFMDQNLSMNFGTFDNSIWFKDLREPRMAAEDCTTRNECLGKEKGNGVLNNGHNGLQPSNGEASVALVVNVGATNDPPGRYGLAHFCEHMVHYGSKKYPGEEAYDELIGTKGTSNNAFTQCMTTTFHFTVLREALEETLDVFASMISEPTFDENMTLREVNAIDNEFCLKEHMDGLALLQLNAYLVKNDHPLHTFACGTKETLLHRSEGNDTTNLKKALTEFHQRYYVGTGMTLAVQSNDTLDYMESMVVNYFSGIRRGESSHRKQMVIDDRLKTPFKPEFNRIYVLEAKQHTPRLCLIFPLPPEAWKDYKSKPVEFLEAVLSNDWEQGLSHQLRSKGLAYNVSASVIPCEAFKNEYTTMLYMEFFLHLSEEGKNKPEAQIMKKVKSILDLTFQYFGQVERTPTENKKRLWNELASAANLNFHHSGAGDAEDLTIHAARLLQILPGEDIFYADTCCENDFDANKVNGYLNMLDPTRMSLALLLPQSLKEMYKNENEMKLLPKNQNTVPFTKTPYWSFQFPNGWIDSLKIIKGGGRDKNHFIFPPNDLVKFTRKGPKMHPPEGMQRWTHEKSVGVFLGHKGEDVYKAVVRIILLSAAGKSQHKLAMFRLLTQCIKDHLGPEVGAMERAGMQFELGCHHDSISFGFYGFADQLPDAVGMVMGHLFGNPQCKGHGPDFAMMKAHLVGVMTDQLGNGRYLTAELLHEFVLRGFPSFRDKVQTMQNVTDFDFQRFQSMFKGYCFAIIKMQGNLSGQHRNHILDVVHSSDYTPFGNWGKCAALGTFDVMSLPPKAKTIRVRSANRQEINSYVANFYQSGFNDMVDVHAVLDFLELFMVKAAFHNLRTQKQLGYAVHLQKLNLRTPTIAVMVAYPAHKHNVCEVENEIDQMLVDFEEKYLRKLDQSKFKEIANLWGFPKTLTLDQVRDWYQSTFMVHLFPSEDGKATWTSIHGKLAKLSIQVLGNEDEKCKNNCCRVQWVKPKGEERQPIQFAKGRDDFYIHDIHEYQRNV